MKSKSIILLSILACLSACQQASTRDLNIYAPSGAPSYAFYNYAESDNFQTNSVPSSIVAMMSKNSDKTVVVIDTVSGISAINNGAPYKIAATITFGNFYLTSTGLDEDKEMNDDDRIILFGRGSTPDLVFHYLYGDKFDNNIEYVDNAVMAASCLETGRTIAGDPVDYVFLAQPAVFATLKKNEQASIYKNIQDEYYKKSGTSMIQASVFIKNTLEKDVADSFLESLEKDITTALDNPSIFVDTIGKLSQEEALQKYGTLPAVAKAVTQNGNGMGLGYKKSSSIKAEIDAFIKIFSLETTDEKIYY